MNDKINKVMGTKEAYFRSISQICDFISVVSAIFLLISAAGGVVFLMIPAAIITAIGVIISAIAYFISKRYEKANK